MPITRGSTPATALPTNAPSGSMPSSRAFSSDAITSAAAPSLMPDELPAVTVPPLRNAGFSAASFSSVVSGRGCSSRVDVADRRRARRRSGRPRRPPPSAAATRARTRPDPRARRRSARRRSRRSRPSTRAGTSPPCCGFGKRQPSVVSYSVWLPRGNALSGFAITNGARDIDSTPPATKRSPSPAITAWHAPTTAERPDAQSRFTVTPATDSGSPASSARHARDVAVVLARLVRAAEPHVLDLARGNAGALDRLADHERREIVRAHARERAAVAPDRRANSREDDGALLTATNSNPNGRRTRRRLGAREQLPHRLPALVAVVAASARSRTCR